MELPHRVGKNFLEHSLHSVEALGGAVLFLAGIIGLSRALLNKPKEADSKKTKH